MLRMLFKLLDPFRNKATRTNVWMYFSMKKMNFQATEYSVEAILFAKKSIMKSFWLFS